MLGNGDGTFQAPLAFRYVLATAVADFDGDGKPDVVVTALGAPAELWLNRTSAAGHWLDVQLQGTHGNRDGIGAVVRVGDQTNIQTSAFSYASSSLGPVHFGLGSAISVPLLEIRWPDGRKQMVRNVPADRKVIVKENE